MDGMEGVAIISASMGVLCLIYYGIVISHAGIRASFSWIWPLSGFGFLLAALIIRIMLVKGFLPPKAMLTVLFCLAGVGVGAFIMIIGILLFHARRKELPEMDYLIILGAQVKGTRVTKSLKNRLDTAGEYLKKHTETKVIVSGGRGKGEQITEAEAMERYLIAEGISSERILKEDQSKNTLENLRFSMRLLKGTDIQVAIVTNGFHIFRALRIAKKLGLSSARGIPAPTDPVLAANYYVREVFGLLKDFVYGNLA